MEKVTKYGLSFFFSITLFLSVIVQNAIFIHYTIDVADYTEKYCENKSEPILKCNGKCHLAKELKAVVVDKVKNESREEITSIAVLIFSFFQQNNYRLSFTLEPKLLAVLELNQNITQTFLDLPFKPPCFVSS